MYLLISLNITLLEEESTPWKYSCNLHKYLFITNFKFVQNGLILLYQDILNILNHDPTYDITSNRRKVFIEFKLCCKFLNLSSLTVKMWLFILIFIMNLCNFFNQTILNYFVIFNIWKFYTLIISLSVSESVSFIFFAAFLDIFYNIEFPTLFSFRFF